MIIEYSLNTISSQVLANTKESLKPLGLEPLIQVPGPPDEVDNPMFLPACHNPMFLPACHNPDPDPDPNIKVALILTLTLTLTLTLI